MAPILPLHNRTFSLDISSLAGFLGAEAVLAVMMLPHLHSQRKWWGWYNCPGSYQIAKRYGELARFRFWSALYGSAHFPPELALELSSSSGSKYTAARSSIAIPASTPLVAMLLEECKGLETIVVDGRQTAPVDVTIADLRRKPSSLECPRVPSTYSRWIAVCPIAATLSASIACAIYRDAVCAAMILVGALCHGLACLVMGNARLVYRHDVVSEHAPTLAHGWLESHNSRSIVILRGSDRAVTPVLRGRLSLQFESSQQHCLVTCCSILLGVQFLLQLLFVPQGTRFGQIMFVGSLFASWLYHQHILAHSKADVLQRIMVEDILGSPALRKLRFGSRTTAAVFVLLVLRPEIRNMRACLVSMLPSDTLVWQLWQDAVMSCLEVEKPLCFEDYGTEWRRMRGLSSKDDNALLDTLFGDANTAYIAFTEHLAKT
ncbi:hypothetical protein L226DRAFT_454265 [Lentinus tigrinus ALCF2SS1-7]|uniref:Uncharacterized protein n=1 Tax=Lentinus tigrinus ALCF2SS1-6 TaxID=1328759 RepID=A0A5C2SRM5_9APHY|nr:hypothetical protein L227DRAFT_492994 [Lentinus tigrinus ALCF2SS1-6]RPD79736.1 hypothetical protein L226DRAFT_454265 [Lentinus tigrinus ALCF2SS1-7]